MPAILLVSSKSIYPFYLRQHDRLSQGHLMVATRLSLPPIPTATIMNAAKEFVSWGEFLLFAGLLGCTLGVIGCGYQSTALNDRMKDFQYSAESLGKEMVTRLKTAHIGEMRKKPSANSRSSKVSQMEADRGGDGNRPDPNSVQAIASDCAAKVRHVQSLGEGEGIAAAIIAQVNGASEIKEDIREAFATSLKEELGPDAS